MVVKRLKVISLGDPFTGKTAMIKLYCDSRFEKRYIPTIGLDYGVKPVRVEVRGKLMEIRVCFWDLSGSPDYVEVRNEIYEDVDAVFLMFDVSEEHSFLVLDNWLSEIDQYGLSPEKVPIVLCANKTDQFPREVSEETGTQYAERNKIKYFETSVLSGKNVSESFQYLFANVLST